MSVEKDMKNIDILGSNFASLYLAYKFINEDVNVRLFLDGQRAGGHFLGYEWEGDLFDIGMVFLEMPSGMPNVDVELKEFDGTKRFDWLRYGQTLNKEMTLAFSPKSAAPVRLFNGGMVHQDYLISDRLDILSYSSLCPPLIDRKNIQKLHAKFKNISDIYDDIDLSTASIFNHGRDVHENLILPFFKKITSCSPNKIMAKFHRVLWLPLYWPETICEAIQKGNTSLKQYNFFTSSEGVTAAKVKMMVEHVKSASNVEVIASEINSVKWDTEFLHLDIESQKYKIQPHCIGLGINRMSELIGLDKPKISDTESLSVGFFTVNRRFLPEEEFSTLNVVDPEFGIYRINLQGICSNGEDVKLVAEANFSQLISKYGSEDLNKVFVYELAHLLSIKSSAFKRNRVLTAKNALVLPTFSNVSEHEKKAREISDTLLAASFTGQLLGYNLASLNDQLAQALQLYYKLRP